MARYNGGTVYTNEKCIACNKCVTHCPILGANVSVGTADKRKILVDERKCINCGVCIDVCSHGARNYKDNINEVMEALEKGVKLSFVVDSGFFMFYGEKAYQALGYMASLGVEHVYDTSFGAEIAYWTTGKYLKDNADTPPSEKAFIINTCPSLVDAIELYHPSLVKKIIPVHSPVASTVIYAREYLNDKNDLVYLGPCVSRMSEMEEIKDRCEVKYFVSSKNLMNSLKDVEIERYERRSDITPKGMGKLSSAPGVFTEALGLFFSISEKLEFYSDLSQETFDKLEMYSKPEYEVMQPLAVEVLACHDGCLLGPGIDTEAYNAVEVFSRFANSRNKEYDVNDKLSEREQIWELINNINTEINKLKYEDFVRNYGDKYIQPYRIPESTYDEIYQTMLKDTEQKRHIDCGSCGYSTCKDMASAIAYGYSRKENCIHYMNDVMSRRYMYNQLTNLYNSEVYIGKVIQRVKTNPDKKYFICGGNVNKLGIINDIYGHSKGDAVLRMVADKLRQMVGEDGLCGYFGGGNFSVFMEYLPENINRLTSLERFDAKALGIEQPVTMRFGINIIENTDENISVMVNYSFMASRIQVSAARNTFTYFSGELKAAISHETEMISKIQKALVNDEFSILFRPKYDIASRTLVGGEVKCHWVDHEGKTYGYEEYVAIAEKNGLIQDMDIRIWTKAFETIRRWLDSGVEFPKLDIMMSMKSALDERMIEEISKLKDKYKISNHHVRFTISEKSLEYDPQRLAKRLRFIRNLGYQVAISDFGTGQSSLDVLTDGSIEVIRIDLDNLTSDEENEDRGGMVLSAISRMTQDLDVFTEADNVRNEAQAGFLKSIGINVGEGALFSEDLKEHEFVELLKNTEKSTVFEKKVSTGKIDIGRFYDSSSYESIMFEMFSGPAAIVEYDESDENLIIARINNDAAKIFSNEPLSVREFQDIFNEFIKGRGRENIRTIIDNIGIENDIVIKFRTSERTTHAEKWVQATIKELSRVDDRHIFYIQFLDITDEQLINDAIRLSNAQMAHIMQNEGCGNCFIRAWQSSNELNERLRMGVLKVSDTLSQLLGYSKEEISGWSEKEIERVIHPMERREFMNSFEKALLDENSAHEFTNKVQNKSGYFKKVKVVMTSVRLEDNSHLAYLNVVGD